MGDGGTDSTGNVTGGIVGNTGGIDIGSGIVGCIGGIGGASTSVTTV